MRYIRDAGKIDCGDILDFANMVFSMEYTGIDFSVYLPKAYGDDRNGIVTHHVLQDDDSNKIIGLIDTYPVKLTLDGLNICADYVGTVAVHPKYRNMGFFSDLMNKVYGEAVSKNIDLLILDGERARYGNYGYEKAGMKYCFNISYKSVLVCCEKLYEDDYMETPAYSFEEVESDSLLIDKMYELYCKRNVKARERKDFYVSLISNKASVFAVINYGRIVGYINISDDEKNISEFELEDENEIPRVLLDLMEGFDLSRIGVTVGADEINKIKHLEAVSEYYNVSQSHQILILNYENVIGFLLKWKQKYAVVQDGEYIFGIKKANEIVNYRILVCNCQVTVERTLVDADAVFDEMEFVRAVTTGYFYIENDKTKKAPAGWFPLPFYLPDADAF
jgi:GNAT superfamily N-acetyltransferase/intracellular sulfur oxidation DsrE/DsrF family protein